MQPSVEAHVRALRECALGLVVKVHRIVEVRRWGEFSEQKLANTLASRARTEWCKWGRKWTTEPNPPFFFEACQRAMRFAFEEAAKSPKVDCVQAAGLRRTFEPMTIGRNFFRAQLWVELDRMLREGVDRIDEELLGWMSKTKPAPCWPRSASRSEHAADQRRASTGEQRSGWSPTRC